MTTQKGAFSLTGEFRRQIDELAFEALFETRDKKTFELDAQIATREAVYKLMAQAPEMVFSLMERGIGWIVGARVLQLIERSKNSFIEALESGEEESVEDIANRCYMEVVSYRVKGRNTAVKKFLGDMTLRELGTVVQQYEQKRMLVAKKRDRFREIREKMRERGATQDTRVSEVFLTGTDS